MTEDRRTHDPFAPFVSAPTESQVGDVQPSGDEPVATTTELPDDLDDISRADLIAIAEQLNVPTYGSKTAIAARVREAMAS